MQISMLKNACGTVVAAIFTTTISVAQAPKPAPSAASFPDALVTKMPDGIPPALFHEMLSGVQLVGSPGLAWKSQRIVTVAFQGGSDDLYALIEQTGDEWTSLGGQLKLSFQDQPHHYRQWTSADTSPAANIRIGFDEDGYWTVLGVLAKNIKPNEKTMNFERFPETLQRYFRDQNKSEWAESYEHTTILHEFGHALGLSHEHFHPQCQSDLKMDYIIRFLMGKPNYWTETMARYNMDAEYYKQTLGIQAGSLDSREVTSRTTDQASVMLYSFSADFYRSGDKSVCMPIGDKGKPYPTTLSAGDKGFYLDNYKIARSPY